MDEFTPKLTLTETDATSGADRRREVRQSTQLKVTLNTPGGQARDVVTKDRSFSGISFITSEPLSLGHDCHVELENADQTFARFVAKVIRCRRMADNEYEIAVQFRRQIAA